MAEMAMYHSLGDPTDPNDPNPNPAPANSQYPHQVATGHPGYQQAGIAPNVAHQYQQTQQHPYGGPVSPPMGTTGSPYMQQGGFGAPPPPQSLYQPAGAGPYGAPMQPPPPGPYGQPDVAGLSQTMSGMDIAGGIASVPGTISKASKKKQRAFHALDQASPPAGMPPSSSGNLPPYTPGMAANFPSQFLGQQQTSPVPPGYGSSQFPVPAAPSFIPSVPADPASFNARTGPQSASQSGSRIDPNTIPSIAYARDASTAYYRTKIFPTLERHLLPNAASDFIAHDQGNASPRICRLTLNAVPATQELLATTALPLALMIQPFASLKPEEEPIPVLDFGEAGPPRCRRCRTYINPFMTFLQGGGRFRCNMCLFPNNEVPEGYYAPVDMAGVRVDRELRPELMKGTVDFVVPKEYWAKKEGEEKESGSEGRGGVPMRYLFLVDVSEGAVNRGTVDSMVKGIREALYGENAWLGEGEEKVQRLPNGCRVGICTFDKEVQFYNLNANLDQAQMMVMPDIEDPFVPLSEGLFVDPYESRKVIESLLDTLPNLFTYIKNPEPALFPALTAALTALSSTGGKIICSLSTLPTWGPNRLFLREDQKIYNTDKEKTLFITENAAWRRLAGKMVETGVGIDFFLTPSAYIDVAAISHLSGTTGGEIFFYPNFVNKRDSKKFAGEVAHAVQRETGYQALMKVRCSNGLQVSNYHGNFLQRSHQGDIEFGTIDQDKCLVVLFSYDGKLDPKVDAHFQSALLYTTRSGERRVRCSNIVAAVTENGKDVVRLADQDAVLGVLAREAASTMLEKPLKEIRGALTEKCVEVLALYRKNISSTGNPPGQLVLPESLKELGMWVLALLKCRAFRGGNVASDMRVHSLRLLKSMSPLELQLYLYPRILPIHSLSEQDGFPDETGHLRLPPTVRASFNFIDEGGAYIIDNGQLLLLWLHSAVSPALLTDLFGPSFSSLSSLDPNTYEIPVLQTTVNVQVRNILTYLSTQRGSKKLCVQLARQGIDGAEYEFAGGLVEDRGGEERSYVDWLVHVHRFVQLEIAGDKKGGEGEGIMGVGLAGLRPGYW